MVTGFYYGTQEGNKTRIVGRDRWIGEDEEGMI